MEDVSMGQVLITSERTLAADAAHRQRPLADALVPPWPRFRFVGFF